MSLVTPLKRTAIIVRDLKRSLRFYRGVLGMNVWVRGKAGADIPALYQLLGMPPCTTRWVILQSDDVDWGMVGLFELTDPPPDDDRHVNDSRANRGEACLVFHTPDAQKVHRGALRMGLPVLCPPTRLEIPQLGVVTIELTVRDPNGVLVNFIQTIEGRGIGLVNRFPGLRKGAARRPVRGSVKRPVKRAVARRSGASKPRRSG
jgi:catechol 2,3-dioxygenase-like lactoylglutathione lyase family enzyme